MRYTLRQLEYFIAAGETGSITLASERINISQPSISTAISQLEAELGVKLFLRHHAQGVSLTPAGRRLLQEAKRLVEQAEALYGVAAEAMGALRGRLMVGCLVTLAPMILPELIHGFTTQHPAAQIHHLVADQERLLAALAQGEIDLAVTYDLAIPAGIELAPLASLPPHALVGAAHALAGESAVELAALAAEPLILLDLPHSRDYFLALFLAQGLSPTIGARSAYPEVVRTMVANGYGYALANVRPRSDRALDGRQVVRVPLAGTHRPMTIGLAALAEPRRPRLLEAFAAHCRAAITQRAIPGMEAPGHGDC